MIGLMVLFCIQNVVVGPVLAAAPKSAINFDANSAGNISGDFLCTVLILCLRYNESNMKYVLFCYLFFLHRLCGIFKKMFCTYLFCLLDPLSRIFSINKLLQRMRIKMIWSSDIRLFDQRPL